MFVGIYLLLFILDFGLFLFVWNSRREINIE